MICIFVFEILPKFIFMGSAFRSCWSAKYVNFGGIGCDIRILSRLIQEAYTLRTVKNQVLLFLLRWEPNFLISLSTFACPRMLLCIGLKLRFWHFKSVFLWMHFLLVATFVLYFSWSVWVEIYILNFLMSFQHLYHSSNWR